MRLDYSVADNALGLLAEQLKPLLLKSERLLENPKHGDFSRWKAILDSLPDVVSANSLNQAEVSLGDAFLDQQALKQQLMGLHPWRKGPFKLAGVPIDCEWRSDWKWQRLEQHLGDLHGQRILDIGCGNGYFGWRMLGAGAKLVVGIDPSLLFVMQYFACRHFADPECHNLVLPLGIEDLSESLTGFDSVFSMGVLYHRRSPIEHLQKLYRLIRPGGQIVLETLVIEGDERQVLVPQGRYARMRNVWFIPSSKALVLWLQRAGFTNIRCVNESMTSLDEQRSTEWMQFESLQESLRPNDSKYTIEGHPAPQRAVVIAHKEEIS